MTDLQRQCLLAYLGYIRPAEADGIWGPESAHATECLQEDLGLEADGIWGPQTDGAVRKLIGSGEDVPNRKNTTGTFWDDIEYFTREEFRCQCGGKYCDGFPAEPQEAMVRACDEIRRRLGVPVQIVDAGGSGVRCEKHNAAVGGVANSEHLYGRAADLHSSASPQRMYEVAQEVLGNTGGLGIYSWGIHVDTGKYSRWTG